MKRLALVLVIAAAACGGSSSSTPDAPTTADAASSSVKSVSCTGVTPAVTVTVTGTTTTTFAFSPANPSIHVNDVIHFMTGSIHPVASGTPGHTDGKFSTNGDACLQFTQAGTFPFFCTLHLFTGTVTVQ